MKVQTCLWICIVWSMMSVFSFILCSLYTTNANRKVLTGVRCWGGAVGGGGAGKVGGV